MQHEKIIKRDDGSKVVIRTYTDPSGCICAGVYVKFDFEWIYHNETDQKQLPPSEILAAKLELWEQLKPV